MKDETNKIVNWIEMGYTRLNYKEELSLVDYIKQLQQENKKYKEVIDKIKEYITIYRSYEDIDGKDYLKGRDEIGTLSLSQIDKLLDILKEVE